MYRIAVLNCLNCMLNNAYLPRFIMHATEVKYAHAQEWIIHFRATNQRNMYSHEVQPLPPFFVL